MSRVLTTWVPFLLLFALLVYFCFKHHVPQIEADLQRKSDAAIASLGLSDRVTATVDGLDVLLEGSAMDDGTRASVENEVSVQHGVRKVISAIVVESSSIETTGVETVEVATVEINTLDSEAVTDIQSYRFSAEYNGDHVVLVGMLPSDAIRASIVGEARQYFVGKTVIDRLRVVPSTPSSWTPILRTSLSYLATLETGKLDITNLHLYFVGSASDSSVRSDLITTVSQSLTDDFTHRFDIAVLAPTQQVIENCQNQVNSVLSGQVIRFDTGSAVISIDSYPLLETIASALNRCVGVKIEIQGHTDSLGDATANQRLSQNRADAVLTHLADEGVDVSMLSAKGYGEMRPIGDNTTVAGRSQNRRIEFTTLGN